MKARLTGRVRKTLLPGLLLLLHASLCGLPALGAEPIGLFDTSSGPTRVSSIHLTIEPDEFDAMQPPPPAGFAPGGPAPAPPPQAAKSRESERNLFGTEFRWVRTTVSVGNDTLKNVGIRYAGDMTYLVSASGLKRPFKLAFDKFDKQSFHGLTHLHLHAMSMDPSTLREAMAYAAFRACGVPAQRTAFAEVTLTVPGRFADFLLGLYTLVEDVDAKFLERQFGSADGLAFSPFGLRGLDHPGDDWAPYAGLYRPRRDATPAEQKRLIAFTRLVNSAPDPEFAREIANHLDVDAFLKYLAANALTANLQNLLVLGHNDTLYLDSRSNRFHFIPGDLEFSHANLLLFGSADELMTLSLIHPYPGENKLPDRLLAIPELRTRYLALLKQLATTVYRKEALLEQLQSLEQATAPVRERERLAVAARPAPPPGIFGAAPPGAIPQPPDLLTFINRRTESIAAQLAGKSEGYVPRPFQFGPPPGGAGPGNRPGNRPGAAAPVDDAAFRNLVQVPDGFEATLFAGPPQVGYPVAIACEPSGAVYVAVDEQGSLGRTPGGGRILRCIDRDDDGQVDDVTTFAQVDHPRGVVWRNGRLWVMHPPTLSVFSDRDGDGVSDDSEVLVTGLTTSQISERGGDHTTNCVRLGIDGWLYIGVGDYGIKRAEGRDGRSLSLRGGGVVRVRPDGTELELYCRGLRNPFDLAIDPRLNLFTRDNTNDGGGWDTRVSLLTQSASYGYAQLFANFTAETMPTLGTFGNGGGTGALFLQHPAWPPGFNNTLFTADWGTGELYRHELAPDGPTFRLKQERFAQLSRATGMDLDAQGRLYVGSWHGGSAVGFEGPNVGFVARIAPSDLPPRAVIDFKQASLDNLIQALSSPPAVVRLAAQGELLARGRSDKTTRQLLRLTTDESTSLDGRIAAVWTLKQLDGPAARPHLLRLTEQPALRETALHALTDRSTELADLPIEPFTSALADNSPRVRAQALISLGRLGRIDAAPRIIPLTSRSDGSVLPDRRPLQNQPDPGRVVPHLAVQTLIALDAVEACLAAVEGPHSAGALMALQQLPRPETVNGLIQKLRTTRDPDLRHSLLVALMRLHSREADYDGSWWGIRPDSTGPWYAPVDWDETPRIRGLLDAALRDADAETRTILLRELRRHRITLPGSATDDPRESTTPTETVRILPADPNNPNQIGNLPYEVTSTRALAAQGNAEQGAALFRSQGCAACHTTADGQAPKGPHLFEIGKRYKPEELVESVLRPSAKLAQGYETWLFQLADGRTVQGFIVSERAASTLLREANGTEREIRKADVEEKSSQRLSSMPEGLVGNLTPNQLADLLAYLNSLR